MLTRKTTLFLFAAFSTLAIAADLDAEALEIVKDFDFYYYMDAVEADTMSEVVDMDAGDQSTNNALDAQSVPGENKGDEK